MLLNCIQVTRHVFLETGRFGDDWNRFRLIYARFCIASQVPNVRYKYQNVHDINIQVSKSGLETE